MYTTDVKNVFSVFSIQVNASSDADLKEDDIVSKLRKVCSHFVYIVVSLQTVLMAVYISWLTTERRSQLRPRQVKGALEEFRMRACGRHNEGEVECCIFVGYRRS